MRILVHICCGPCAIMPLMRLKEAGHDLTGFFFNPNIQPLAEYLRRREGALRTAERLGISFIFGDALPEEEQRWNADNAVSSGAEAVGPSLPPAVDPAPWLRAVAGRERCPICWAIRLRKTAHIAQKRGFEAFTSSLLYSRRQRHETIAALGQEVARDAGVHFLYEDFRVFWQEGIILSKEWGIYRQQYCGCVFSEYERYARDFSRAAHGA